MPLVVLCGQPCSGKSTVAAKLQGLLAPDHPVHVVDEPSLHLERNSAYQSEHLPLLHCSSYTTVGLCQVCTSAWAIAAEGGAWW